MFFATEVDAKKLARELLVAARKASLFRKGRVILTAAENAASKTQRPQTMPSNSTYWHSP